MGHLCDFCGEQRSMVYCRSDSAYLCLSCDRNVHSANALSKRHSRTLLCDRCHCQPAVVRCIEEELSLCQNCNWTWHSAPDSSSKHKHQTINCYSGCPSAAELSRIWSFFSVDHSICKTGTGSAILDKGNKGPPLSQSLETNYSIGNATMDTVASDVERFCRSGSLNALSQKGCSLGIKHRESTRDTPYHEFDISDMDLSLENLEDYFDGSLDDTQLFENSGLDDLFEIRNFDDTECNLQTVNRMKGFSSTSETMHWGCSNTISMESLPCCKSDPNIGFQTPAQSTLSHSFCGPAHELSTLDYEESGGLPMVITEEQACYTPYPENHRSSSAVRDGALLRYREKKKSLKFDKKIRYASRKAGAEIRKRVKGRFVKAGDPYDYDPLNLTRSR